jgi:2'-5' RNA ligase
VLPPVKGMALWLLPDLRTNSFYSGIIGNLADLHQSDPFIPHITISRVPDLPPSELNPILDTMVNRSDSFYMVVKRVVCRKKPYQKICLELIKNNSFDRLTDNIDASLNGPYSQKKDPHLSLLYSRKHCNTLSDTMFKLEQRHFKKIRCTELAIIHFSGQPSDWTIVHRTSLKQNIQD